MCTRGRRGRRPSNCDRPQHRPFNVFTWDSWRAGGPAGRKYKSPVIAATKRPVLFQKIIGDGRSVEYVSRQEAYGVKS